MKMKNILFAFAVLALTAACAEVPVEPGVDKLPINTDAVAFSADIQSATKATDIAFEEGDQISVFATEKGTLQIANYAQNVKYTYSGGLFTTSGELVYPDEYTYLSFYAVYPYDIYSTPEFTFSVNEDQSGNMAYTESDLMTASQIAKDEDVVDLTFTHRMCKVIINLNAKNLPAGDQTVLFNNVYYKAKADLTVNSFKSTGSRTVVTACPNGTNSFKVLLPPQTITKGSEFVDILIGNKTYVWEVESDIILSSGVEYSYTLTLKENNVSFTSDINPWNTPSDLNAVIPKEYVDLMSSYIPIYEGNTPPNIEGIYYVSPNLTYYDSQNYYSEKSPSYIWFYNQTSGNTLSMKSTQNIGNLSVAEGVFVSGSGNNFTVYFNEYSTQSDGAWLVMATLISGTKSGNSIKNYRQAFVILDDYDPNDEYMDVGDFRVLEDGDYVSGPIDWPLETKSAVTGESNYSKK